MSPLFASFLVGQVGRADENQQATIRRIGILDETHQHLFYELFKSHYYIEWEYLQEPRADDPTVYLVNGEDRKGNKYRPRVVKVGTTQEITEEIEKTRRVEGWTWFGCAYNTCRETVQGLQGDDERDCDHRQSQFP